MIKPIHDNILLKIEELKQEEKTETGLIISNRGKSDQMLRKSEGEVIAIGEGRILNNGSVIKPSVKVGDRVLYNKFAGTEVILENGEKHLILKENDIVAIIDNL